MGPFQQLIFSTLDRLWRHPVLSLLKTVLLNVRGHSQMGIAWSLTHSNDVSRDLRDADSAGQSSLPRYQSRVASLVQRRQ